RPYLQPHAFYDRQHDECLRRLVEPEMKAMIRREVVCAVVRLHRVTHALMITCHRLNGVRRDSCRCSCGDHRLEAEPYLENLLKSTPRHQWDDYRPIGKQIKCLFGH